MQKKTLILSLLLVLFIAGCTGSSGTQTNGKEILKITNLDSFPKNIVHPGETFILRATVKNVAQAPATFDVGKNGKDILFDYCSSLYTLDMVKVDSEESPNDYHGFEILTRNYQKYYDAEGKPTDDNAISKNSKITLDPHEEAIFQWTFKAPEEKEIGADMGLSHTCTFKTQVKYNSTSKTTSHVYFADQSEIMQRTYTGDDMKSKGDSIATSGPVIANLIPSMTQPIPTTDSWTFYIQLLNTGDGIVEITDLTVSGVESDKKIEAESNEEESSETANDKCNLEDQKDKFKIYGQKSSRISCTTNTPEGIVILEYKKYVIDVDYIYTTRKDLKIKTESAKY